MILSVMKPYTIKIKNDLLNQDLQHLWCSNPSVICLQFTALSQLFNIDIQYAHELLNLSISRKANVMITMI